MFDGEFGPLRFCAFCLRVNFLNFLTRRSRENEKLHDVYLASACGRNYMLGPLLLLAKCSGKALRHFAWK